MTLDRGARGWQGAARGLCLALAVAEVVLLVAQAQGNRLPLPWHPVAGLLLTAALVALALLPGLPTWRPLLAGIALAAAAAQGFPIAQGSTLPWLLPRTTGAWTEGLTWLGTLLLWLHVASGSVGQSTARRLLAPAAALLLGVSTFFPLKLAPTVLATEGRGQPVPVMVDATLQERWWTHGAPRWSLPALHLHPTLRERWTTADIAHGINAWRDDRALEAGALTARAHRTQAVVRRVAWTFCKGLTAALLAVRLLLLPAALWLAWRALRKRPPAPSCERVGGWVLAAAALLRPLFGLAVVATFATLGMPDHASAHPAAVLDALSEALLILAALGAAIPHARRPGPSATLGAATAVLLLAGCSPAAPPAAPPPSATPAGQVAPDLVIVTVAGLREDSFSGAGRAFLDAAHPGPRLESPRAWTASPSTFVSLGSLLTGRYPSAIPLCGHTSAPEARLEQPWCTRLPPEVPTLPGVLALYGYRTALLTANVEGAADLGAAFQATHIVAETWDDRASPWEALTAMAVDGWQTPAEGPRLLVIAVSDLDVRHRPALVAATGIRLPASPLLGTPVEPPRDMQQAWSAYRDESVRVGQRVATLLAALPPGDRPSWVVLAGSNGVMLGEGAGPQQVLRWRSWSDLLLDTTLHVPLALVPPPGGSSGEVPGITELVDVFPTLAGLAGAMPPAGLPGRDWLGPAPAHPEDRIAYAEFGDQLALRSGEMVLSTRAFLYERSSLDPELTSHLLAYQGDPERWYLHDLARDPRQGHNLVQEDPETAARLHRLLVAARTGPGAPPENALDPQRIWELHMTASEGYW